MKILWVGALCLAAMFARSASIEGEVELKETKGFREGFTRTFGDNIKARTQWRVGDFFGSQTVFATVSVTNAGVKPLAYEFYVAFYDKDQKLVGSAGQGSSGDGFVSGRETQLSSCLIKLPPNKYKEIKFYQAVIYESEPLIKKK